MNKKPKSFREQLDDAQTMRSALVSGNAAAIAAANSGDMENAKLASMPGGIEAQEKAGQTTLVAMSDRLPIQIGGYTGEALEMLRGRMATELGFKWGQHADELFIFCKLPEGWKIKASEHSMHSDLLDADGCVRAGIFYKAAFYDRKADMRLNCRYVVFSDYTGEDYKNRKVTFSAKDTKTNTLLWTGETIPSSDYKAGDQQELLVREYLEKHFPNYRDPMEYWV